MILAMLHTTPDGVLRWVCVRGGSFLCATEAEMREHLAKEHGIDPDAIAGGGDTAGAQLVLIPPKGGDA